jgi:hypothetical protein
MLACKLCTTFSPLCREEVDTKILSVYSIHCTTLVHTTYKDGTQSERGCTTYLGGSVLINMTYKIKSPVTTLVVMSTYTIIIVYHVLLVRLFGRRSDNARSNMNGLYTEWFVYSTVINL